MSLSKAESLRRLAPRTSKLHDGIETETGSQVFELNFPSNNVAFCLDVTAKSGTNPTLDVKIENVDPVSGKVDTGAAHAFTQQTAEATEWEHPSDFTANKSLSNKIKVTWTIGGTDNPTFTFTLSAIIKAN